MSWLLFAQLCMIIITVGFIVNSVINNAATHAAKEEMKVQQNQYDLDRQFYKETGEMRG